MIRRIAFALLAVIIVAVVGGGIYLAIAPPELLRVADGYAAKIVCSNLFLAKRDPNEVLQVDVQAPGNPVLKLVSVSVDSAKGTVTAWMLGFIAPQTAVSRPGLGCTLAPDGKVDAVKAVAVGAQPVAPPSNAPWPEGSGATAADPRIDKILNDPALTGAGMRAVVVIRAGKLVGERYGEGFDLTTPLLGWSMSKSINAILLGSFVKAGRISFDDKGLFPQWQGDARKDIRLRDLLNMTSGLQFNEDYGDVTDVTRMLYLEPDMASFAANQPLVHPPGSTFNYSTGTAVMISRIWMNHLPLETMALTFPRTMLFGPLGMNTAVIEPDEAGTLVGSSYMYANARDWARLGQFLLQDGVWNGQPLLPEGFVKLMQTSNGLPGGYSQMQTWLEPDYGLPSDSFWLEGHDGQFIAVIPSAQLVVVRMGLTPSDLGYSPAPLVKAVLAASG